MYRTKWPLLLLGIILSNTSLRGEKNILFLMSDDMRPNIQSYENSNSDVIRQPYMHTPNLDLLASEALQFNNAYCQLPLCAPSRTSFLTGRRPDTTRVTSINPYWRHISGNFTTIPQFFKENGYRTVGGGKIFHPGVGSGNDDPISWSEDFNLSVNNYRECSHSSVAPYIKTWKAISKDEIQEKGALQDTLQADWAIDKLRELAPDAKLGIRPFFLAFGTQRPHLPFCFPEDFLIHYPEDNIYLPYNPHCPVNMPEIEQKHPISVGGIHEIQYYWDCIPRPGPNGVPNISKVNVTFSDQKIKDLRRAYYASITYTDSQIGRIINELKELELDHNTIIVFLSDHGYNLGEHAQWCKENNFETSARVPFLIKIPGMKSARGVQTDNLVELVDLFPTLVEAAGFEKIPLCPENSNSIALCSEGASLLPLFENQNRDDWKDAVFWQQPNQWGTTSPTNNVPTEMGYSIRTRNYRYTEWVKVKDLGNHAFEPIWNKYADHEELYELGNDPQENVNLYDRNEYIEVKLELSERLHSGWRGKT